jgi:hypothetical protein
MSISPPQDDKLSGFLSDRPSFKLYAAAQHLNNLKSLEVKHESLVATRARLKVEMEIDCFLTQIVGAVDSILVRINEKLELGIPINRADFDHVKSALSAKTKKIDLLSDLDKAREYSNWYWQLNESRNHSLHRALIPKFVAVGPHPIRVYFKKDPRNPDTSPPMELEIIPYLEQCLTNVEQLIDRIRSNEPLLN